MWLALRHLISGAFLGTINTDEMMSARRVGSPCSIVIIAYLLALMLWCEARSI